MPIFEYTCHKCGHSFEKLVLKQNGEKPVCPKCGSRRIEQEFSAFATSAATQTSTRSSCVPSRGG